MGGVRGEGGEGLADLAEGSPSKISTEAATTTGPTCRGGRQSRVPTWKSSAATNAPRDVELLLRPPGTSQSDTSSVLTHQRRFEGRVGGPEVTRWFY